MDAMLLLGLALILLLSAWFLLRKDPLRKLPGPRGLPLVGYLPFMTSKPYVKLQQLAKEYGPVYRIRLGGVDVVVLCDYKIMKDAFNSEAIMGRPPDLPFNLSQDTIRTGAILDKPWKEQKRFSIHMLRDLGLGKSRMEEHVKEEILEILQRMESLEGKPTVMSDLLAPSMSNNIASLLFGKRLKYDDPKRQKLDRLLNQVARQAGAVTWQTFFPWIRAIMEFLNVGGKAELLRALNETKKYIVEEVKHHEATLDENNIRDFIDGYLLEIKKRGGDPNTTFTKDVMIDLARGFFGAGSETVKLSVDWMLLICIAFPEVQRKIQAEIDAVLGRERFPTRALHQQMPYTEAAITEMHRWKTIISLNLMRYTLEDAEIGGFFIPRHTRVLGILYAIHHDKELWGSDADDFKPERFLSKDGKSLVKPDYYIPFSTGKRQCPGKSLAEMEVFLYIVTILQKFQFSMPGGKAPDMDGTLGIGVQPKKQEVIFKSR